MIRITRNSWKPRLCTIFWSKSKKTCENHKSEGSLIDFRLFLTFRQLEIVVQNFHKLSSRVIEKLKHTLLKPFLSFQSKRLRIFLMGPERAKSVEHRVLADVFCFFWTREQKKRGMFSQDVFCIPSTFSPLTTRRFSRFGSLRLALRGAESPQSTFYTFQNTLLHFGAISYHFWHL